MTTYTVTGHPLNYADLGLANTAAVRNALQANGVGQTLTLVLSAPTTRRSRVTAY